MPTIHMTVNPTYIGEFCIKRAIENYVDRYNEIHCESYHDFTFWSELIDVLAPDTWSYNKESNYIEAINFIIKNLENQELSKDDDELLLFIKNVLLDSKSSIKQNINVVLNRLQMIAEMESQKKDKGVVYAINSFYTNGYLTDEKLDSLMEEFALKDNPNEPNLNIDEIWMKDFGEYALNEILHSKEFVLSLINYCTSNTYETMSKQITNVLNKYKNSEFYDELLNKALKCLPCYVYCKKHKEISIVPHVGAKHWETTENILMKEFGVEFRCDLYDREVYPIYDKFIKENIVYKNAWDPKHYMSRFESKR